MTDKPFELRQNIFKESHPPIRVVICHENDLTVAKLRPFLDSITANGAVGVAPVYGSNCVLTVLAFSTFSQGLIVRLTKGTSPKSNGRKKKKKHTEAPSQGRKLLQDNILCHASTTKYAFKFDKLAFSLYYDLRLYITDGVDLLSLSKADRWVFDAMIDALGGEGNIERANVVSAFKHEEGIHTTMQHGALQAWAACRVGSLSHLTKRIARIRRINTWTFDPMELNMLAKTCRDADRLTALKPTRVKNDVDAKFSYKSGNLNLTSTRYRTRVMRTSQTQRLEVETKGRGKPAIISGKTTNTSGRAATVSLKGAFTGDKIHSITTVGREDPTNAEGQRSAILLQSLQRNITLLRQPLVRRIWFPPDSSLPEASQPNSGTIPLYFSDRKPNSSQVRAIKAILSDHAQEQVVLIHGPPGTGKTTVIASAVINLMSSRDAVRTLWLLAQSNVAVKNIAEKLAEFRFLDFKVLVSKEFHFDWHEHLYEKIQGNIIKSTQFIDDTVATNRLLLGSKVILCTLSMLSNDKISAFTRIVPIQTVIVDEASQIDVGDYLPMFYRFQPTLRKVVFIGDDKQLAPYGQEDLKDLDSIFELPHLRDNAVFLDTQYRMPIPIGSFISGQVYDNRLKSSHPITARSSCQFIDVYNGKEEKCGHSWINVREVQALVQLARRYTAERKSFRIITPYDAQRSRIERELKDAKLPWEDKCFNVDSFQGNEDDHILISLVRSVKVGFLREPRRVNVMLTRCKKSMTICTSKAFLEQVAPDSLVAALAVMLGKNCWSRLKKETARSQDTSSK